MSTAAASDDNLQRVDLGGLIYEIPRTATAAEYEQVLAASPFRIEWIAIPRTRPPIGRLRAMAGGSYRHAEIVSNLVFALRTALDGGPDDCRVRPQDARIRVGVGDDARECYPDLVVHCEAVEFVEGRTDVSTNPTLLIEVTSPGTEATDRGEKYLAYTSLPSLREYVLVSQSQHRVERFVRRCDDWLFSVTIGPDAAVTLDSLGVTVPMAALYRGITVDPPPEPGE